MIFIVEYDRDRGEVLSFASFADHERQRAEQQRLALELHLHSQGVTREVVLLEAASEEALRTTHRRYFEGLEQLVGQRLAAG